MTESSQQHGHCQSEEVNSSDQTRIIVKNLPRHTTEQHLRERFSIYGKLTDCKLLKTKEGVSRQIAFLGFSNSTDALKCIKKSNRSFLDTARIVVEYARERGSDVVKSSSESSKSLSKDLGIWSKYTKGTTAYEKRNTEKNPEDIKEQKEEDVTNESKSGESIDEKKTDQTGVAFDDDLDDMAYLKQFEEKEEEEKDDGAESKDVDDDDSPEKLKVQEEEEEDENSILLSTGRLYVTNLPYSCSEADLRKKFESEGGDVESVKIVTVGTTTQSENNSNKISRGFGYVSYVFPEHAVAALSKFDQCSFMGRIIRVKVAKEESKGTDSNMVEGQESEGQDPNNKKNTSSYKRERDQQLKKRTTQQHERIWNLLYVSANSAASAAASNLNLEKRDLMSHQNSSFEGDQSVNGSGAASNSLAVTSALGETHIIGMTKRWLIEEGIRVEAFARRGEDLMSAREIEEEEESNLKKQKTENSNTTTTNNNNNSTSLSRRSTTTLLIKHLPSERINGNADDLKERFTRHGEVTRFCLAPSKTVAIVEFKSAENARKAFLKTNLSRYERVPLFVEWAPETIFKRKDSTEKAKKDDGGDEETVYNDSKQISTTEVTPTVDSDLNASNSVLGTSLFLKNLNFSTTESTLETVFAQHQGFRKVMIPKKKVAKENNETQNQNQSLSMGFAFVEFATEEQAKEVLKKRQNMMLDGHRINMAISNKKISSNNNMKSSTSTNEISDSKTFDSRKPLSNKLCIRNVPFEANQKELRALFSTYGTITSLRLPKKGGANAATASNNGNVHQQHRGFCFLDFLTKAEALSAFESLQHTHFYGRRLVIEPAERESLSVEEIQRLMEEKEVKTSEKQKRAKEALVDGTGGESGSFKEMAKISGGNKNSSSSSTDLLKSKVKKGGMKKSRKV